VVLYNYVQIVLKDLDCIVISLCNGCLETSLPAKPKSFLVEGKVTYKQNVSTRIGTVKKQNPAIAMITGF
jgi:hypothetical protein